MSAVLSARAVMLAILRRSLGLDEPTYVLLRMRAGQAWIAPLGTPFDEPDSPLWTELVDTSAVDAADGPLPMLVAEGNGPLLDPDCRDGKHTSCVGAPCECTAGPIGAHCGPGGEPASG